MPVGASSTSVSGGVDRKRDIQGQTATPVVGPLPSVLTPIGSSTLSASASPFVPRASSLPSLLPPMPSGCDREFLSSSPIVLHFLRALVDRGQFVLSSLKRAPDVWAVMREPTKAAQAGMSKPNGMDVEDMFDPLLFVSGDAPVTDGALKPDVMAAYHNEVCPRCQPFSAQSPPLDPDCYFYSMYKCLVYGWAPPIDRSSIRPRYKAPVGGNYLSASAFERTISKEITAMEEAKIIQRVEATPFGIRHPLGGVIKNSDKARVRLRVDTPLVDDDSLDSVNAILTGATPLPDGSFLNEPKVKVRPITDASQPGVNRAAYSPPFTYPSLSDMIHIITPGCYLAKGDVGRYFFAFSFAHSVRSLFYVVWLGIWYLLGFTACPYYTSTFSAEFRRWFRYRNIRCAHMVDDWLTANDTHELTLRDINYIATVLTACGFSMAPEKFDSGQLLVFIGFYLDTVNMTLRFDPVQARSFKDELSQFLLSVQKGELVPHGVVRHICGKLNWFSEVVQSGRLHTRAFWLYLLHGNHLSDLWKERLSYSIQWWITQLTSWAADEGRGNEYRMYSASVLREHPDRVFIIQSDASGTDGFGYLFSTLAPTAVPSYVSVSWPYDFQPPHSYWAELEALRHAIQRLHHTFKQSFLIWVTDSLSGSHSINRGRCHNAETFAVLEQIFTQLDDVQCQIIALYVPREHNQLADYLSHLSRMLHRDECSGSVEELLAGYFPAGSRPRFSRHI